MLNSKFYENPDKNKLRIAVNMKNKWKCSSFKKQAKILKQTLENKYKPNKKTVKTKSTNVIYKEIAFFQFISIF